MAILKALLLISQGIAAVIFFEHLPQRKFEEKKNNVIPIRTRVFGLSLFAIVFLAMVLCGFSILLPEIAEIESGHRIIAGALIFDRIILDFILFLLIGAVLINGGVVSRIFSYGWSFLLVCCYIFQLLVVYISGGFLSFLAVDNFNHISLLVNLPNVMALSSIVFVWGLVVYILEKKFSERLSGSKLVQTSLCLLVLAAVIHFSSVWAPDTAVAHMREFYENRAVRVQHKSPMEAFYNAVFKPREGELRAFSQNDADRASQFGITLDLNRRNPLVKPEIYQGDPPFNKKDAALEHPNVILVFAEGLSARTVDFYGGAWENLTPNLADFAENAMVVTNYYNHTYATYRGLLGQLCSIFPARGGLGGWHTHYSDIKKTGYYCLNDLFKQSGYETGFLDTHRKDAAYIDEMMLGLGFDQVYTAENLVTEHGLSEPLRSDSMSDQQLFEGLIRILKAREQEKTATPFFLSMYNLETHVFQKIASDGKAYSANSNYILDTIHNYDDAFGKFWRYFQESGYASNTVVIFTADHARYSDRDYVDLMQEQSDYLPYFVDKIPLVIYDQNMELPQDYDAQHATSLNLAPSIAHLLGLKNGPNAFTGRSIFEANNLGGDAIASADQEHYLINSEGIVLNTATNDREKELEFVGYLVNTLRQLEIHDRLWPENFEE